MSITASKLDRSNLIQLIFTDFQITVEFCSDRP